jgi:hypothetical protein
LARFFDSSEKENQYKHPLTIKLEKQGEYVEITTISEGSEIHQTIQNKINSRQPIKGDYELSGLDLIRQIVGFYEGEVKCESKEKEIDNNNSNRKYQNSITVRLKLEKYE